MQDPAVRTLVVGCGNILRGDDAVGPVLVRRLWELGLPDGVRCADGGTGGMDVAFQMRGVPEVILVDACRSGSEPGALFELPGSEVETLPPLTGINLHAFRWDHALAFARWLLKDEYPQSIKVYLIEAAQFAPGEPLSPPVAQAMERLAARLLAELRPPELTETGYLVLSAPRARQWFPADALAALVADDALWLYPVAGAANGGLLLKQRNAAGDRAVLLTEVLGDRLRPGPVHARWDAARGALRVALPVEAHAA